MQKALEGGLYEVVRLLLQHSTNLSQLLNVSLRAACRLGYAARARAIFHNTPTHELLQCIEESCKFGFPETALGVIIDIRDSHKQKACLDRLRKGDVSFPPNDTIIQRQTPKIKTKE